MTDHSFFYHDPRTHLLAQEIVAFEAMKSTLTANHLGQYAAIFRTLGPSSQLGSSRGK
jgi:hypothetical protein